MILLLQIINPANSLFFPINAGIGAAFSWDNYESGVVNGVFFSIGMFRCRIASYWAIVLALRDRKHLREFTILQYPSHLYALHFPFSSEQITEFMLLNIVILLACINLCV